MENKTFFGKEKKKAATDSTESVAEEVGKNDLINDLVKNDSSSKDLNEDFLLKDLNGKDLDAFCHAMTRWQIRTSYGLAETLREDATFEEKQLKCLKKS